MVGLSQGQLGTDTYMRSVADALDTEADTAEQAGSKRRASKLRNQAREIHSLTHRAETERRKRLPEVPLHDNIAAPQVTGSVMAEQFAAFEYAAGGWSDLRRLAVIARIPVDAVDILEAAVRWHCEPVELAELHKTTEAHICATIKDCSKRLWRAARQDPYHQLLVYAVLREVFDPVTPAIAGYPRSNEPV